MRLSKSSVSKYSAVQEVKCPIVTILFCGPDCRITMDVRCMCVVPFSSSGCMLIMQFTSFLLPSSSNLACETMDLVHASEPESDNDTNHVQWTYDYPPSADIIPHGSS